MIDFTDHGDNPGHSMSTRNAARAREKNPKVQAILDEDLKNVLPYCGWMGHPYSLVGTWHGARRLMGEFNTREQAEKSTEERVVDHQHILIYRRHGSDASARGGKGHRRPATEVDTLTLCALRAALRETAPSSATSDETSDADGGA